MMDVANLENCERLYELSEWTNTEKAWRTGLSPYVSTDRRVLDENEPVPAYDLGYLLRKLKPSANREWSNGWKYMKVEIGWDAIDEEWDIGFKNTDKDDDKFFEDGAYGFNRFDMSADTPEDAAAQLAIKLFEENILRKGV